MMRHGQTAMSVAGTYTSYTDVVLSERGQSSARQWAPFLLEVKGFHSPLVRASETATLAGLDSVACAEMTEWNLGELEGQSSEEYRLAHPDWTLFRHGAPGGETPREVLTRADQVIDAVADLDEDVVVLVGHGQFSKTLATRYLDLPLSAAVRMSWGPARAAVFSWRVSLGDYALAGWNRTPAPISELLEENS